MQRIEGKLCKKLHGLTNYNHEVWKIKDTVLHITINKQGKIESVISLDLFGTGIYKAEKKSVCELNEKETIESWEFDKYHSIAITIKNNTIENIGFHIWDKNDYRKRRSIIGNGIRWLPEIMEIPG